MLYASDGCHYQTEGYGYDREVGRDDRCFAARVIAAIVLLTFGNGPVRGFAVTLALGIVTSMFTAIIGTRVIVNTVYGNRNVDRLSI